MKLFISSALLLVLLIVGACVSVKIPTGSGARAKDVKYSIPEKPFRDIENAAADQAWISEKTGNTISYVSECNGSADPTLQQLENDTLGVLNKLTVTESKEADFNGRTARSTVAEGEVDGVAVKTELLIFKRNGCNYTLSYGGILKNFEAERRHFQKFTQGFHAP